MTKDQPLISVIVTTYNNHATLDNCLASIAEQDYANIELIVVDNFSTDDTAQIAKKYTPKVYTKGPERSAQRNYAVQCSSGDYVVIIDSDMELTPHVISECVYKVTDDPSVGSVIIPEESFGEGFWAQCKKLERSFYIGVDWIEAARFFRKELFEQVGGYDPSLISGEDWDLARRIAKLAPVAHIDSLIMHNEGHLRLGRTLKKKYYYSTKAASFLAKNPQKSVMTSQEGPINRYKLFLSKPTHLFRNPVLGLGMLFMKTCEFGIGGLGYLRAGRKA